MLMVTHLNASQMFTGNVSCNPELSTGRVIKGCLARAFYASIPTWCSAHSDVKVASQGHIIFIQHPPKLWGSHANELMAGVQLQI